MLTNCFRFAPRDSVPGLIAKICKYLKDHPGWSEEELEEQIKQFIGQTGVESFNGRTGAVVLNENDVNNLKIASAYFAEGDETIDEIDVVALYNQGVRFVFTNWNSVTSGYDLSFVLDYFSGSNDVVYYPMSTGSGGGGNIISVNGKNGIVELSLSDILGDSGAQVKLCTAMEFTSTTLTTWNAYYEEGYRIVGVVNSDASAIDYIYLLKQDENNHQPIGLSTGASDAYTPTNPPPYPVTSVNGETGAVTGLYSAKNKPPYPVTSVNNKTGDVNIKVVDVSDGNTTDENAYIFVDESEDYPPTVAYDSLKLNGKDAKYYIRPLNILDNSDFTNPVNQRNITSLIASTDEYTIDRWRLDSGKTINVSQDGVSIDGGWFTQFIEPNKIDTTKIYTAVIGLNDETIVCETGVFANKTRGVYWGFDISEEGVPYLGITTAVNAKWVALYEGEYTIDNIPPYLSKGFATEMTECLRYFERLTSPQDAWTLSCGYMTASNTNARFTMQFHRKRKIPAINVTPSDVGIVSGGSYLQVSSLSAEVRQNLALFTVITTESGTPRTPAILYVTKSVDINADF